MKVYVVMHDSEFSQHAEDLHMVGGVYADQATAQGVADRVNEAQAHLAPRDVRAWVDEYELGQPTEQVAALLGPEGVAG